jgi:carbonic anhydrase/acetyltransferase-like protein (isoleucine patch superfamily)
MSLYEFDGKRPQVPDDSFVHPLAALTGDVKVGHECLDKTGTASYIIIFHAAQITSPCLA